MTTIPAAPAVTIDTEADYLDAVARALAAATAYYGADESGMDDATYDALVDAIAAWEGANPDRVAADSPTQAVAAGVGTGDVPHAVPMLSLEKATSADGVRAWAASLTKRLGGRDAAGFAVEPKLDGTSLAARYRDGRLAQLITRGNGSAGEDVTHAAGSLVGLPLQLAEAVTLEVRGEVLMSADQFEAANKVRVEHGGQPFANRRNASSGSLRAEDRAYTVEQTFFAYGAVTDPEHTSDTSLEGLSHTALIARVAALGLGTTLTTGVGTLACATIDEVLERIDAIGQARAGLAYELDGAVIKADTRADRTEAGLGSRTPHWAVAFKYPADKKITTLRGVEWNVGRTGIVAPRAILEPVEVGGTVITYATLHNPADILRKDLRLGDRVYVLRAGEVIPRVEGAVAEARTGDEVPIAFPEACPRCGGDIDKAQERWRCVRGRACGQAESARYAVSRDCLDIDGMGEKVVDQLVERRMIEDFADLFTLTRDQLLSLERMGETSADKLLASIAAAKTQPLNRVFCALGIQGTGRSMSLRIASHFGSMEAIQAADAAALEAVDGIGGEKAPVIVAELAELAPVIAKLQAAGVNMDQPGWTAPAASGPAEPDSARPLAGMAVVVTGTMTGPLAAYSRTEMNELITRAGGKASSSVSAKTGLVVAGEKAGSKRKKAEDLGIEVTTPEAFAERLADLI